MASSPSVRLIRVFVDSSVLVAAAISATGSARALILRGIQGDVTLAISALVLAETERNLSKKAPASLPAFETFKSVLVADLVDPSTESVMNVAHVIEIKDAPIVAGAIEAQADFLASFDRRHLLSQAELIRVRFGIIVATPDEVVGSLH